MTVDNEITQIFHTDSSISYLISYFAIVFTQTIDNKHTNVVALATDVSFILYKALVSGVDFSAVISKSSPSILMGAA